MPAHISFVLLLMVVLSSCRVQKGVNYPNTKTGVRKIANALNKTDDNALVKRFRATLEDCQAIMKSGEDAKKLYDYSEGLYGKLPDSKLISVKKSQTEVLVSILVPGNDAKSEKDRFAGGYIKILDKFKEGISIYTFRYVRPGRSSGMRYDGLTYINKKWVFIPKMWRAFW